MAKEKQISGFSKLNKLGKIKWLVEHFFVDPEGTLKELKSFWLRDEGQQEIIDGFSENTISNYMLPFGVAPNFLINGKTYAVPMVIEESSVVAAASSAAKFWLKRGGFKAEVLNMVKIGQVHFEWQGNPSLWESNWGDLKDFLLHSAKDFTTNMENRGGGILDIVFKAHDLENQYALFVTFDTIDSMGANFINTILELFGQKIKEYVVAQQDWPEESRSLDVIMAILSNYTPDCLARVSVECSLEELYEGREEDYYFAHKFKKAIDIAQEDVFRATTHNKGIFNGIDSVILATGNDFRAVEACGHAYAARDGQYRSLSYCIIENNRFKFGMDIPLAIGTVGGLTNSHPLAKKSLEMLGNPDAKELMQIVAAVGLAQNFAAVRSLVTGGIQKGHMKMHLSNILNQLEASEEQKEKANSYFADRPVSFQGVRTFLNENE